ncbi:LysR family transcriptional regulator [Sediminivirga luteola]|uniref:LysR family transcriptional regulator n=1 Tax=Sediminivirga luteola TaxID=1774748 RepID=A0A8J2TYL6_9MICO|nr:LysR family transcriptional regulator [Sediminivirga luteola]GGA16399.1 LysR family transcriptional regulator [Sediminivirga luteola]
MALPTVRQLEYFVTAARVGTLSAAAAEHHIAQPSLSEQIAVLERTLRVPLFTRTSRRLLLTDAGKQLLPLAERALQDTREIELWSRRIHDVEHGTVSFGTFSSAHLYLLPHLVRDFRAAHPGVRIQVAGLNSAEVAEAVRTGRLEAGLVQLPVDDRELAVTPPVFTDQAVYAARDPERTREPVDIRTLAARPLVLSEARWEYTDPLRATLLERAQRAGVALEPVVEVEFQAHAFELAAQGVADCLVSYHVGRSQFTARGMSWAPLDPPLYEHYAFITRKDGAISPATKAFMDLAHRLLSELARAPASAHQPG